MFESVRDFFSRGKKKALIIEGGGMRGIFIQGVLQSFNDMNYFPWKLIVGTSAGALTAVPYASGQLYISRDMMFSKLLDSDFINLKNILRPSKHILNLDWMIEETLGGEYPLDLKKLAKSCPVIITATDIRKYEVPRCVCFDSRRDDMRYVLKATAALPFLYRGFVEYRGYSLLDGGIMNPVPYDVALNRNFAEEDIVVICTRPKGYRKERESFWTRTLMELYYHDKAYEPLVQMLDNLHKRNNRIMDELEYNHPNISVIYPPENFNVERLTKDHGLIAKGFMCGIESGRRFLSAQKRTETKKDFGFFEE